MDPELGWPLYALVLTALGTAVYLLGPMRERMKRIHFKVKDWFEIEASADDPTEPPKPQLEAELVEEVEETPALPAPPVALPATDCRIQLDRLPVPGREFFGRDEEIAMLDRAWDDPDTLVQSLVAFGGVGKTSLVHHWLEGLRRDGWRGAEVAFGWSFDSQGSGEERQTSADPFLDEALRFFGETDPPDSRRDRALRLTERIRGQKTLLVLDGLEPLQHPPNVPSIAGEVKDKALAALLGALARDQPGLTVISTRETVRNLEGFPAAQRHDLERLDLAASEALLRSFGLDGRDAEFREIAKALHGHALTLTLLGTYLRDACQGDIRKWRDVPLLDAAETLRYKKAFRVMAKYADWFDGPEQQILSILGLFDRLADAGAVAALRKEPAIEGLTDQLVGLTSTKWNVAVSNLRKARLLLEAPPDDPHALDAHPLVREHFGRALEEEDGEAFRAGHARLYEHYAAAAPDLPDTLDEMQPLYRAVHHGSRAGRRQEVYDEVYMRRILRGEEFYSLRNLGAFGSELTAVSAFFERTWDRPAEDLGDDDRAWLLNTAAFCLRALGRLDEAVQPFRASLEMLVDAEDWKEAAIRAGNLSELTLTLGRVDAAVGHGESSVELADRSADEFWHLASRATWGEALHAAGRLDEAESAFREAESMQAEWKPQYPKLYSLQGYRFCDLLLGQAAPLDGSMLSGGSKSPGVRAPRGPRAGEVDPAGVPIRAPSAPTRPNPNGIAHPSPGYHPGESAESSDERRRCEEVRERAAQTLEWATKSGGTLLSIALDHLSLGRAQLGLALADGQGFDDAATSLNRAVHGLRKSGHEDHIPWGLIARAMLHRFREDVPAAKTDLAEALEIAERGSMKLYECDTHLEWGRLCFSVDDPDGARQHLDRAAALVEETGYHRRDREVEALRVAIGG